MAVRMPSVEVIDRDPVELGAEILLDLRHQLADEGFEVRKFRAVLGRDDEAELVAIAGRPLEESWTVGDVDISAIECSRLALARHAITLDIPEVRPRRRHAFRPEPHQPRFHDGTAGADAAMAVAAGKEASHAPATPNAATVERALGRTARLARAGSGGGDLAKEPLALSLAGAPHPAKAWLEMIVLHHDAVSGARTSA